MKSFFRSLKDGLASIGEGFVSIGNAFAPCSYEDYVKRANEYVEKAKKEANATRHYNIDKSDDSLKKDSEKLASDWKNVGDYLRDAMEQHKRNTNAK